MWTRDKVLNGAAHAAGLSDYLIESASGMRAKNALEAEGLIWLRIRTLTVPAMRGSEEILSHMRVQGYPTDEHEVTIKTWHLTEAGRAAWIKGGRE